MNIKFTEVAFLIFLLGLVGLIQSHEQVHVEIYKSYGIESHVKYLNFPAPVTIPEEPCPTDACILAHNNNEVFGYQFFVGIFVISLFLIIIIAMIEIKFWGAWLQLR